MGVGPIETVGNLGTELGRKEMMATTAMHFDHGHALNGFGFVTGIWETSLGHDDDLSWWLGAVRDRWPDTKVITEGAFGLEWRKHTPSNAGLNYRFVARGTGAPGSEPELEIQPTFRTSRTRFPGNFRGGFQPARDCSASERYFSGETLNSCSTARCCSSSSS